MITDEETTKTAHGATHDVELDAFVPRIKSNHTDDVEIDVIEPRIKSAHQDQHPHYTHELPEPVAEAASRVLIRIVPPAYGFLLGGLSDYKYLGLAIGMVVAVIADLILREHSFIGSLARSIRDTACPAVAMAAHGLATLIGRLGGTTPVSLSQMRCKVPNF